MTAELNWPIGGFSSARPGESYSRRSRAGRILSLGRKRRWICSAGQRCDGPTTTGRASSASAPPRMIPQLWLKMIATWDASDRVYRLRSLDRTFGTSYHFEFSFTVWHKHQPNLGNHRAKMLPVAQTWRYANPRSSAALPIGLRGVQDISESGGLTNLGGLLSHSLARKRLQSLALSAATKL